MTGLNYKKEVIKLINKIENEAVLRKIYLFIKAIYTELNTKGTSF